MSGKEELPWRDTLQEWVVVILIGLMPLLSNALIAWVYSGRIGHIIDIHLDAELLLFCIVTNPTVALVFISKRNLLLIVAPSSKPLPILLFFFSFVLLAVSLIYYVAPFSTLPLPTRIWPPIIGCVIGTLVFSLAAERAIGMAALAARRSIGR